MKPPVVHGGGDSKKVSAWVWGGMLGLFLIFELLGLAHRAVPSIPWYTASEEDWEVLSLLPTWAKWLARVLLIGFFTSLGVHFGFGTPLLP